MAMGGALTVGVIGLGVGRKHLDVALAHPDVRGCVVTDLSQAKVSEACQPGKNIRAAESAEVLIDDPEVDVVCVASYDRCHADQVVRALRQGKHVFVEKPMCLNREEASRIRAVLAEASGQVFSSNLPLRATPRFQAVRQVVQNGDAGVIYNIRADYLWGRIDKLTHGWRRSEPGYSIILGASVHMVDLVLWLTGRVPVEVRAVGSGLVTRETAFQGDDFVSAQLLFQDGLIAEISAHGGCVHPHFHRLEVYGSRRTFLQDTADSAFWVVSSDPAAVLQPASGEYPAKETRGRVLGSFLDAVCHRVPEPMVPSSDVFRAMAVCFACQEACRTGQSVRVESLL